MTTDLDATEAWLQKQQEKTGRRQLSADGWHPMRGLGPEAEPNDGESAVEPMRKE